MLENIGKTNYDDRCFTQISHSIQMLPLLSQVVSNAESGEVTGKQCQALNSTLPSRNTSKCITARSIDSIARKPVDVVICLMHDKYVCVYVMIIHVYIHTAIALSCRKNLPANLAGPLFFKQRNGF